MLPGQLSQPLCLSFLIYKMGIYTQTSQDVARIKKCHRGKHLEGCLAPGRLHVCKCLPSSLKTKCRPAGGSYSVAFFLHPPPHSLSCRYRVMLDSVAHSTFLPNASFCDPLMSWTDLFSNEEYYPAFEHQTGVYVWRSSSELGQTGAGGGAGLRWVTMPCWGPENASSHQC